MPKDETPNLSKREQFEQDKLTRRAALRKLGFGAGLSAFALLGVDDLARMVGRELEKRAGDNAVAGEVAREFQKAGVASASPDPSGDPCQDCWNHFVCQIAYCDCFGDPNNNLTPCKQQANSDFKHCTDVHCGQQGPNKNTSGPCNDCPKMDVA